MPQLDFTSQYVSYYPSIERVIYDIAEEDGKWHEEDDLIRLVQEERPEFKEERIKRVITKMKEAGRITQHWA